MAFDGLFTHYITAELNELLASGRITKIHQPFTNEILLIIRSQGKNHKLLLSTHAQYTRIQLTNQQFTNPHEPPMFCQILRQHLEGGIIQSIKQFNNDRIICLTIKNTDDLGDTIYRKLIFEIMGKHANMIVIDDNQKILDSIKHLTPNSNRNRTIMPGFKYELPPTVNKINPITFDFSQLALTLNNNYTSQQLVKLFEGISPLVADYITKQNTITDVTQLSQRFKSLLTIPQSIPTIFNNGKKEDFYFIPLDYKPLKNYPTLSDLLEAYYFGKADRDRIKQQASDLSRYVKAEYEKNIKKLRLLQQDLEDAQQGDLYQLQGELLTANLHQLHKGMLQITVDNYYTEPITSMTINLDPLLTPNENAQKYFSKYHKSKTAKIEITKQIQLTKQEIEYFDLLTQQLDYAQVADIPGIREELEEQGYLKQRHKNKNKIKKTKIIVDSYLSPDGIKIYVGKNNKQNDYLTHKFAKANYYWLHAKDMPGSHVIVASDQLPEATLKAAAILAAYHSKGGQSSNVAVDYTQVRHVKKPSGAKLGFVNYFEQKTVHVHPDKEYIRSLDKNK